MNKARRSKRALAKLLETNVTNTIIDIHLMWAGKGTCCFSVQSTFGPLVSAIHVSQDNKKQVGRIVGITLGGVAVLFLISSVFYLWLEKKTPKHVVCSKEPPIEKLTDRVLRRRRNHRREWLLMKVCREEGSATYMGPRLILFGGATALEGNSANVAETLTSAGGAGIRF
nr:hypothetical protein [Tanacetum cinerariifolium]